MGVPETRNLNSDIKRIDRASDYDLVRKEFLRQEMERAQRGDSAINPQSQMPPEIVEALGPDFEQAIGGPSALAELFSPSTEQVAARKLELGEITSATKRTRALTDALPNSPLALMLTMMQAGKSRGKLDKLDDLRSREEKQQKASKKYDKLLASLRAFVGTKAEFEKVFATAFREASEKNPNISEQDVAGMKDIRAILSDIIKFPELTRIEEDKFRERKLQYVELLRGTDWKLNNKDEKLIREGLAAINAALAGRGAPGSRKAARLAAEKAERTSDKIGDTEKYKTKSIITLAEKLKGKKREKGQAPFNVKIPNSTDPGDNTWTWGTKKELAAFNKANNIVDESVPDVDPKQIADPQVKLSGVELFNEEAINLGAPTAVKNLGERKVKEWGSDIQEVMQRGKESFAPIAQAFLQTQAAIFGKTPDKDYDFGVRMITSGSGMRPGVFNDKNRTYVFKTSAGKFAYGFSGSAPIGKPVDTLEEARDIARALKLPYGKTYEWVEDNVQTHPEYLDQPKDEADILGTIFGGDANAGGASQGDLVIPSGSPAQANPLMTPGGYMNAPLPQIGSVVAGVQPGSPAVQPSVVPPVAVPAGVQPVAPVSPTGAPSASPAELPPVDPTKIAFAKVSKDVVKSNANTFKKDATIGRILYTIESSGNPNEVSYPLISLGKDAQGAEKFKKDKSKPIQAVGLYQVKPSTAKSIIKRNKRFAYMRTYSETQLIEVLKDATLNGELAKIIWDEERASLLRNKLVKDWPPSEIKVLTFGAYNAGRGKFADLLARSKPKNLADFLSSDVFGKGYAQTLSQMNKARQLLPVPVGN